jgi:hypothetical protein
VKEQLASLVIDKPKLEGEAALRLYKNVISIGKFGLLLL